MRKAVLSASLIAAGLLAAAAVQAQVLVTPAYTYTTVTTSPVFVSNGPDIPAGPDYPYDKAHSVALPAPALITSPVSTTTYYTPTPVLTLATPVAATTTVTSSTAVMGGASETSNTPLRAGEASTMSQGAPNLVTSNDQTFSIVSASPVVIYRY